MSGDGGNCVSVNLSPKPSDAHRAAEAELVSESGSTRITGLIPLNSDALLGGGLWAGCKTLISVR